MRMPSTLCLSARCWNISNQTIAGGIPSQYWHSSTSGEVLCLERNFSEKPTKTLRPTQRSLVGVQEKPLTIRGTADLTIQLCGEEFPTQVIVVESLSSCAILGQDFL